MTEKTTFIWTLRQRAFYLALAGVLAFAGLDYPVLNLFATGMALASFVLRFTGVTLSAAGITIQSITRMTIPWDAVRDVELTVLGTTRMVTVHYGEGKSKRLRAPVTSLLMPDDRFDEKAELILRSWEYATGRFGAAGVVVSGPVSGAVQAGAPGSVPGAMQAVVPGAPGSAD